MAKPRVAFGNEVRIKEAAATQDRGLVGVTGMVVGVGAPESVAPSDIVGDASPTQAVLVSTDEAEPQTRWIAADLLEVTADAVGFDVVDGLRASRTPHDDLFAAAAVRVRATPETEAAGYADLVGEIMGETIPSSSGVAEIVGTTEEDYAINLWFEEKREQAWFAPELLSPADDDYY
jgi:hypothetical protein